MRVLILLIVTLLLSACGTETKTEYVEVEKPQPDQLRINVEWSGEFSSWWEIPQYYNGVPKYSGAFGTYTHKHIPVAVEHNGDLFSVRTDNTEDENFYVYAMKNGVSVKVHTIENWNDPHTNAAINLDGDGYVWVHVASRGLAHKFQSGKVLRSKTPYELDFECVDGCLNINYEAYPQIHNTAWGMHLIYTHYELDYVGGMNQRRIYSKVGNERTKLSNLAHYSVSYYDSSDGELCVASNTLIGGSPDNRVDLSVICTDRTGQWFKADKSLVDISSIDESDRIVYDTQSKGIFVYLKDIISTSGTFRVLFTESDSYDPTTGTRWLSEWVQGVGVSKIVKVGHNYSAGAYIKKDGELYIVAGKSNTKDYLSGSLELYDTDYTLIDTLKGEYSYVRRVFGANGKGVLSKGDSSVASRGEYYYLEIK